MDNQIFCLIYLIYIFHMFGLHFYDDRLDILPLNVNNQNRRTHKKIRKVSSFQSTPRDIHTQTNNSY